MILTGKMVSAKKAKEIGLVNHVTKQEELLFKAEQLARQLLKNSPVQFRKQYNVLMLALKI